MAVYYKFKSAKDYDSINIEGQFISVGNLKDRIFESKHLGRGTDFDLMVSNAQTDEEYVDEAAMIPKNTSVLIRRVPGCPRKTIVTEPDEPKVVENKVEELPPSSGMLVGNSSATRYPEENEWDEFGNDLYDIPEVTPAQPSNPVIDIPPASQIDEDSKIKALVDTPSLDWNRQTQDAYGAGRGFGRGMGGRMIGGRGFGRGGFERKTPPPGYVCHRCKVPGHFIQHCPTNGDPTYDVRRVMPPTGIPKSMLLATPDGSYALPSGAVAVLKPNEAAFEKEIEGLPSSRPISDLPPELRCPLCKEVMKDAVLTSKCCFRSFCDKCIRDYIISKAMCECGTGNVLADDLLPNKTLRETISRILESTTSSAENAGSLAHVPDMESARNIQPKVPSPTLSAAYKDEPKLPPPQKYSLDVKEDDRARDGKAVNIAAHSFDKKSAKTKDPSEATPESTSMKEPLSPQNAPMPEDTQEKLLAVEQGKKKKKKKTRLPGGAADMQWRPYQDFGAENFSGLPLGPSAFNPYWAGGMPLGIDAYMAPFGGAMPYMGYPPGPFDIPYGGVLPPDPFAAQGYMMPGLPQRDLSDLSIGMVMNQGPPVMSREEFEARKADLRRKRELDRRNEREGHREERREEHLKVRGREMGGSADVSPVKAKPRLMSRASTVERPDRHRAELQDRADRTERLDQADRAERLDRADRTERPDRTDRAERPDRIERAERSEKDRHAPPRDSVRHSPSRSGRRRSSDRDTAAAASAAAVAAVAAAADSSKAAAAERKPKGSVFSRISFPSPGEDDGGGKKRKADQMKEHDAAQRASVNGKGPSSSAATAGRRGYEQNDSSEEEDDHHFKRRPSSLSRMEREDERRAPRGPRDREHGQERPAASKHR